jgi:hypothetical protein
MSEDVTKKLLYELKYVGILLLYKLTTAGTQLHYELTYVAIKPLYEIQLLYASTSTAYI